MPVNHNGCAQATDPELTRAIASTITNFSDARGDFRYQVTAIDQPFGPRLTPLTACQSCLTVGVTVGSQYSLALLSKLTESSQQDCLSHSKSCKLHAVETA